MDLYDFLASEHAWVFWRESKIESYVLWTCMISSLANMHGYFDENRIESYVLWTCVISSLVNMHGYFDQSNRELCTMDLYEGVTYYGLVGHPSQRTCTDILTNRIESYVLRTCRTSEPANMHGYFDESKIESYVLWTCMISSRFGKSNLTRSNWIHDSCFMGARKTLCMTLRLRTCAFSVWINSEMQ